MRLSYEQRIEDLSEKARQASVILEDMTLERSRLEHELQAAEIKRDAVLHRLPVARPSDLNSLSASIGKLNGEIAAEGRSVTLGTLGIRRFLLIGKIALVEQEADETMSIPTNRDAAIAFEFFDLNGDPIDPPRWTRQSDRYGPYAYIRCDALGWFDRLVELPGGTASMTLTVRDNRTGSEVLSTLSTSHMEIVSGDLMVDEFDRELYQREDYDFERPGPLLLEESGTELLLKFHTPTREAHFSLELEPLTSGKQSVSISARVRIGDQPKEDDTDQAEEYGQEDGYGQAEEYARRDEYARGEDVVQQEEDARQEEDGDNDKGVGEQDIHLKDAGGQDAEHHHEHSEGEEGKDDREVGPASHQSIQHISRTSPLIQVKLQSAERFTQIVVRLKAQDDSPRLILASDRPALKFHYPAPVLAVRLAQPTMRINELDSMAVECGETGRWIGVQSNLHSLDGPLLFVKRVIQHIEDEAIFMSFAGTDAAHADRRGLLLILRHFDERGRAIPFSDVEFTPSAEFGSFQYIPVTGYWQDYMARLPIVEGSAYLAASVRPWRVAEFRSFGAKAVILPIVQVADKIALKYVDPRKPEGGNRAATGVFAQFPNRESVLLPNSWRKDIERKPDSVLVRLGEDISRSVWRDTISGQISPDMSHLHALVSEARDRDIPVILDVSRLPDDTYLPIHMVDFASKVVINTCQLSSLDTRVDPEFFEIVDNEAGRT